MKPFVKSFTINLKKWGHASERNAVSGLLRDADTGKQCCLGIYLSACGYDADDLDGEASNPAGTLDGLDFWANTWPNKKAEQPADIARELAQVNDAAMKLPRRKALIAEGFKKLGVKVRFV